MTAEIRAVVAPDAFGMPLCSPAEPRRLSAVPAVPPSSPLFHTQLLSAVHTSSDRVRQQSPVSPSGSGCMCVVYPSCCMTAVDAHALTVVRITEMPKHPGSASHSSFALLTLSVIGSLSVKATSQTHFEPSSSLYPSEAALPPISGNPPVPGLPLLPPMLGKPPVLGLPLFSKLT